MPNGNHYFRETAQTEETPSVAIRKSREGEWVHLALHRPREKSIDEKSQSSSASLILLLVKPEAP